MSIIQSLSNSQLKYPGHPISRVKAHALKDSAIMSLSDFYLINTSNIPNEFRKKITLYPEREDLDAFHTLKDIQLDIELFTEQGRTLYLWSRFCGNAKTSWVTKIMNTYLAVMCYGNGYKDLAWFEYAPSFVLMAKEFKNNERLEHIKNLSERPLCIIDDIGAVNPSNYDMSVLSSIIDTRYSKGLATLYTSNISPDNLELLLGARNADRILSDIVIELQGTGRRGSTSEYKRKE